MPSERVQRQIERFLDAAEEAMERLDWAEVRTRAQAALALDPGNDDALTYLAAADRSTSANTTSDGRPAPDATSGEPVSVAPPTATSFAGGRYQMARLLGEGATKKVYLAHDTRLDRDVALGLIRTQALDDAGLARVKREAQAMARLGDHPNVVAVYDIGEEAGQPYIVSQLMQGGDVERLLKDSEDHRLPLEQALKIADQLCAALEHAHHHGIVHRDLKPGNVWLTSDGTAKLGDFGLAVALDRSRLTQAGMMVGTVSYMPPEQALAGEVTPRSDLYSLGCMLYEMVCGRPPFVADESIAIITQHLNIPPIAPTWHWPDCPPALEALILRLLEKDPARRPASAAEARRLLAAIDLSPVVHTGLTQMQPAPYGAQDNPLYRHTFVGREPELRQLQAAFDSVLAGNGGLAMVVGEPGIGKTALCEQLATYASVRGGRTIAGHCYEEGSFSLPYLAFVEAIRTYVLNRPPEALREELGSGAADVARIVSEVRERVAVELRPAGDPEEDRYRLLQAVTEFLRSASTSHPLVLVLEDLHWADRGTLDLLQHLARNLSGARLLVVGTYRDVEVDRAHPLAAALAELRRTATVNRVLLRGLTPDEVQRMLASLADQDVPWGLAEAVHRQTEGNPLFIQEVIRYLVEEGLLTRDQSQWQRAGEQPLAMSIPEGLRDVIGRRLDRLSPECNRLLTIAAVIGRDFTLETLQTVASQSEEQVLAGLEEAVRVGVVEEQSRPGTVSYRFAHAFFRQTLYEEMIAPRRIRLHQQIARTLEQQYAARLDDHAAELADHFGQSSDPADLAKAVQYSELGAQRALTVYAYTEAVRLLEQAIEVQELLNPDDKLKRCDLLLALGAALNPAGEPQRVYEEVAEAAYQFAEALGDRQRMFMACRLAYLGTGRHAVWAEPLLPAYRIWTERVDQFAEDGTVERAWADQAIARLHNVAGRTAEAKDLEQRAVILARELGQFDVTFQAAIDLLAGDVLPHQEAWRRQLADEALTWPRHGIDWRVLGPVLRGCGAILLSWGERDKAEAVWQDLRASASVIRDPFAHIAALWTTAAEALLAGELERVLEISQQIVAHGEQRGAPQLGENAAGQVAWQAAWYLGRPSGLVRRFTGTIRNSAAFAPGARITDLFDLWIQGRRAEAQQLFQNIAGKLERDAKGHLVGETHALTRILQAVVVFHDRDLTAALVEQLQGLAHLAGTHFSDAMCIGRHLGDGAMLLGRIEDARHFYHQALEVAIEIRHRPEIALVRLGLAEVAVAEGQRNAAREHLVFCTPEFETMKMAPALERARALQEALHA